MVVSGSTAGAVASLRVQVWRKLRSLGAFYLQQSVCLLPARPEPVREVRRLVDRIRRQGGTARVLPMAFTDPAEERAVVGEINAARDAEYAEILERLPELHGELAAETAREVRQVREDAFDGASQAIRLRRQVRVPAPHPVGRVAPRRALLGGPRAPGATATSVVRRSGTAHRWS